jgi:amidohydrolase
MTMVAPAVIDELGSALAQTLPPARVLRRAIHAAPQLSGDEGPTTAAVLDHLADDGRDLQVQLVAGTGAVVRFGGPGPAVAIRAELDALPVTEQTGVRWAGVDGVMHACGHDVNIAAAAAVSRAIANAGAPVPLLLVLQPREETAHSGAVDVLASGVLGGGRAAAIVAAHLQPLVERGKIACTPGPINASADEFAVVMTGQGGHAAYPHHGADPVLALSLFVVAVQQLVSRETDPMAPAVVTVGALNAGASPNVRPDSATAAGTIRAMSEQDRSRLHRRLTQVAAGIADANGCQASVTIDRGEPVLHNDPGLTELTLNQLHRLGLLVAPDVRSCGADDFSWYAGHVPALMMFVGTGPDSGSLHSATFLPDDSAVDHVAGALLAGYLAGAELISP